MGKDKLGDPDVHGSALNAYRYHRYGAGNGFQTMPHRHHIVLFGFLLFALTACDSGGEAAEPGAIAASRACLVPTAQFGDGGIAKDAIAALTDPVLLPPDSAAFMHDSDRVIGLVVDGQSVAVPHNILWNHEIANFNFPSIQLAITYCPLTGSSMAFDRAAIGGGEFGVSGLLFQNNLTMYDRTADESLWPQMTRQAACGPRLGATLTMIPVIEMTWEGWKTLYPETRVASETGFEVGYTAETYPYGEYAAPGNDALLFPLDIDGRNPPKARLLGIPDSREGGVAFLFSDLDNGEPARVVHELAEDGPIVVFWNKDYESAMAYRALLDGTRLTFQVRGGRIVDVETRSEWRVDGLAIAGPLAGARLEPVAEAYVAFWFAWAAFHPETRVWEG